MSDRTLQLHLVSDSTGETVHQVTRAALAQFNNVKISEHIWTLVRTPAHVETIGMAIKRNPGILIYSVVDGDTRIQIEKICRQAGIPSISVLDPLVTLLTSVLGYEGSGRPGRQHKMDNAYFERMAAVEFAVNHDDGINMERLAEAQILLVGVSRTSKTPTAMYLANRGYRVANYALVPHVGFPLKYVEGKTSLFIVGLTTDAKRLLQVRRNRLQHLSDNSNESYADFDSINDELTTARKLFSSQGWPVLDVSRRSVEETAAAIIHLHSHWIEEQIQKNAELES